MPHQQHSHPRKYGKDSRACRCCTNSEGLIRKYELMICRRCFREQAAQIGFKKLRWTQCDLYTKVTILTRQLWFARDKVIDLKAKTLPVPTYAPIKMHWREWDPSASVCPTEDGCESSAKRWTDRTRVWWKLSREVTLPATSCKEPVGEARGKDRSSYDWSPSQQSRTRGLLLSLPRQDWVL